MAIGIKIKSPIVGVIGLPFILFLVGQEAMKVWTDLKNGMPPKSTLVAIEGLPQVVHPAKTSPDDVFVNFAGRDELFRYGELCADDERVRAQLGNSPAPVSLLYDPRREVLKISGVSYNSFYEIRSDRFARSYEQCEQDWIGFNRFWRWIVGGSFAFVAAGWLASLRKLLLG